MFHPIHPCLLIHWFILIPVYAIHQSVGYSFIHVISIFQFTHFDIIHWFSCPMCLYYSLAVCPSVNLFVCFVLCSFISFLSCGSDFFFFSSSSYLFFFFDKRMRFSTLWPLSFNLLFTLHLVITLSAHVSSPWSGFGTFFFRCTVT